MGSDRRDAIRAILERRSVRGGFSDGVVLRDDLALIARCGLAAPSSKNAQPWRMHIVTSSELLRRIAVTVETSEAADDFVPRDPRTGEAHEWPSTVIGSAKVLAAVPAAIFVENLGSFSSGRGTMVEAIVQGRMNNLIGYTLEVLGLGAAIENMLLAATDLGYGAAFMGDVLVEEDEIKAALGIAHDLVGVITIGCVVPRADQHEPHVSRDLNRVIWHE